MFLFGCGGKPGGRMPPPLPRDGGTGDGDIPPDLLVCGSNMCEDLGDLGAPAADLMSTPGDGPADAATRDATPVDQGGDSAVDSAPPRDLFVDGGNQGYTCAVTLRDRWGVILGMSMVTRRNLLTTPGVGWSLTMRAVGTPQPMDYSLVVNLNPPTATVSDKTPNDGGALGASFLVTSGGVPIDPNGSNAYLVSFDQSVRMTINCSDLNLDPDCNSFSGDVNVQAAGLTYSPIKLDIEKIEIQCSP